MVCIYCSGKTQVTNSRSQRLHRGVWRRRACQACKAHMTSEERYALEKLLSVQSPSKHLQPFKRDELFISVYRSLSHRKTALSDATALTDTIISRVVPQNTHGLIKVAVITQETYDALKRFDKAAATHYLAHHPIERAK